MILIRFFHFFAGYVEFKVTGGFLERFLNLCNVNGLNLWNMRMEGDVLYGTTDIASYKHMHTCARRTGSLTRVVKKHGAPFLLHRYRHRAGLLVGIFVFAIIMSVLSSFIWVVEVEGANQLTNEQVLTYFQAQGLKKGSFRYSLDLSYLENKSMAELPELSWISINLYGSKAVIELRERTDAPLRVEKEKPCNIKATQDGQIVTIRVYEGYAAVSEGDSVVKGDLLVSAVNEPTPGGILFYKHANALILARTQHELVEEVDAVESIKEFTGKVKKRNFITFFGMHIPLGLTRAPKGEYELKKKDTTLKIEKTELPITFHSREYHEYTLHEKPLSEQERKEKAVQIMNEIIKQNKMVQNVETSDFTLSSSQTATTVIGKFVCIEKVGVEEAITEGPTTIPE